MKLTGTNLSMIRGDTETLTVYCSVPFENGDTVSMTVRESVDSGVAFREDVTAFGNEGEAVIPIAHADTAGMDFGDYVYDVQVTRADGTVTTLIPKSRLTLEEEVTYD